MEKLRTAFMAELSKFQLDKDITDKVMKAFDLASSGFEVKEQELSLSIYDPCRELYKTYIACQAVEGLSKQTLYNYKLDLEKFFRAMACPLHEIQPNMIRSYLHSYQQAHNVGLARMDKLRQCLSGFFGWAADEDYIPKNPMRNVKPIKCPKRKRKALTREQLEEMRRCCKTYQERAILDVLFATGCRVSELVNIKKTDFDFATMKGSVIGKGDKERTAYLNPAAKLSLRDYYLHRRDDSPYMIVSTRSPHPVTRETVGKIIKRIGERAGIPWVSPHIIRHTSATIALQGGMAVQDVQAVLGHEKIETTMIYLDLDEAHVQAEHLRCVV